jgi:DNA polymerase-3 subunit delta
MATPQSQDVLGRITLVTGPEEFLGERAVAAVRSAVRRHDAEAEISETMAGSLTMAELGDLASPSLFSTTRCIVVRRLEDLPEESAPGLLDYAAAPAEDVALVLAHSGGPKGSGLLTKLRKLAAVTEVKSAPLTAREFPGFVVNELRGRQVRIDPDAADFLIQAVGQDLRALSAAASQLANDFEGQPLTTAMVKQYFGGRA